MSIDKQAKPSQWWLEAGPETCMACELSLHFEAVTYCEACDRPFCSLCVSQVRATGELLCAECEKAE